MLEVEGCSVHLQFIHSLQHYIIQNLCEMLALYHGYYLTKYPHSILSSMAPNIKAFSSIFDSRNGGPIR